jgi:hypothetical protein
MITTAALKYLPQMGLDSRDHTAQQAQPKAPQKDLRSAIGSLPDQAIRTLLSGKDH